MVVLLEDNRTPSEAQATRLSAPGHHSRHRRGINLNSKNVLSVLHIHDLQRVPVHLLEPCHCVTPDQVYFWSPGAHGCIMIPK